MKTFIYGRPAVDKGDRGYRIFKFAEMQQDEARQLKDLFSDQDPDVRALDKAHFEPFYAWFPWRDDLWIFGKGRIEAQGKLGAMYYSYLFHGVLLDASERKALHFNPFILANFFDLETDKRTTLPSLPERVEDKGYFYNLIGKFKQLEASGHHLDVGGLLETVLDNPGRDGRRVPHRGDWDDNFWGTVYFLLPNAFRRNFSLATWGPFLEQEVRLCCGGERGLALALPAGKRSVYSELPGRLAREAVDENRARFLMNFYEAAAAEVAGKGGESGQRKQFLEKLFRAVERPSARSLVDWPAVGAELFPHKLAHLRRVWDVNRDERQYFPDLAANIWHQIYQDYAGLNEQYANRYEGPMRDLFGELRVDLDARMVAEVLDLPRLAGCLVAGLDGPTFLRALRHARLQGESFRHIVKQLLQARLMSRDQMGDLMQIGFGKLCDARGADQDEIWKDRLTICAELDPKLFEEVVAPLIFTRTAGMLPFSPDSALWHHCRNIWVECIAGLETGELAKHEKKPKGFSNRLALARLRLSLMTAKYGGADAADSFTAILIPARRSTHG